MQFHIFILFRFLCKKRCSKAVFRVLDEKSTHKHVLRRQMTEIGNLTSWPQMTLTSEKVNSGSGRFLDMCMSQTRIMSIGRLLMRLFSAFCGGKALNGNVKHFVWPDLTCDLTGDSGTPGQIFPLHLKDLVQGSPLPVDFFPPRLLVTEIGGGGGGYGPPAEGRGRTRPSRARVKSHDPTWWPDLTPTIFYISCKIAQWKSMPSLVPLLLSVSEV